MEGLIKILMKYPNCGFIILMQLVNILAMACFFIIQLGVKEEYPRSIFWIMPILIFAITLIVLFKTRKL